MWEKVNKVNAETSSECSHNCRDGQIRGHWSIYVQRQSGVFGECKRLEFLRQNAWEISEFMERSPQVLAKNSKRIIMNLKN